MSAEAEFRDLFAGTAVRVRAFVRRHCAESDCDDVVADVYLVAWRRFADVPEDPIPWLLGTARRVLANHWRGRGRRDRLRSELEGLNVLAAEPDVAALAVNRGEMLRALAALLPEEREVLLLAGWDGLDAVGVAAVLGCSAGAARMRLSRARQRLEGFLAAEPAEAGLALVRRSLANEGS